MKIENHVGAAMLTFDATNPGDGGITVYITEGRLTFATDREDAFTMRNREEFELFVSEVSKYYTAA